MTECMAQAAELAKKFEIKTTPQDTDDSPVDNATSFDGSWNSPGQSSTKGVAAAIAQNTSQVVDVMFKSSKCCECEKIKEKRKAGQINEVAYVDWLLKH